MHIARNVKIIAVRGCVVRMHPCKSFVPVRYDRRRRNPQPPDGNSLSRFLCVSFLARESARILKNSERMCCSETATRSRSHVSFCARAYAYIWMKERRIWRNTKRRESRDGFTCICVFMCTTKKRIHCCTRMWECDCTVTYVYLVYICDYFTFSFPFVSLWIKINIDTDSVIEFRKICGSYFSHWYFTLYTVLSISLSGERGFLYSSNC